MRQIFLLVIASVVSLLSAAQPLVVDEASLAKTYPFVRSALNGIEHSTTLDSFFQKLLNLRQSDTGQVRIVHIGDSHIQPDLLTAVIRNQLQSVFGNAGRGLVFPYQLAQSNSPDDIRSTSPVKWEYNRLAHPEIDKPVGVSGFGIQSMSDTATFTIHYRSADRFDIIRYFAGEQGVFWATDSAANGEVLSDDGVSKSIHLYHPANAITFSAHGKNLAKVFYGVSFENTGAGVIYHSIGVNGARYDQYNRSASFWAQLPALKADLFIVSLGTNEAQRAALHEASFKNEIGHLVDHLRKASPGAAILITTAADSYKRGRWNAVLLKVNETIRQYCSENTIALWDLYRITNGYGSAYTWARRGLMARDRVHFNSEGYRLMGSLLYSALAKGFNNYLSSW